MSKGPGHIERAIEKLFEAKPNDAFSTRELCACVYAARVERKHRVAVIRAANNVRARMPDWHAMGSDRRGHEAIFYNHASLMSYALARVKSGWTSEKDIRASLKPGGFYHDCVVEGGAWWRHVEMYLAERDGQTERAEALRRENDEDLARIAATFKSLY